MTALYQVNVPMYHAIMLLNSRLFVLLQRKLATHTYATFAIIKEISHSNNNQWLKITQQTLITIISSIQQKIIANINNNNQYLKQIQSKHTPQHKTPDKSALTCVISASGLRILCPSSSTTYPHLTHNISLAYILNMS